MSVKALSLTCDVLLNTRNALGMKVFRVHMSRDVCETRQSGERVLIVFGQESNSRYLLCFMCSLLDVLISLHDETPVKISNLYTRYVLGVHAEYIT